MLISVNPVLFADQGFRYQKLDVILTTSVDKLGKIGEVVKVAPGHLCNHLMPKLLDVPNIDKLLISLVSSAMKLQNELVKSLSRFVLILTSMKYLLMIVMDLSVVQRWKPLRLQFRVMDSCLSRWVDIAVFMLSKMQSPPSGCITAVSRLYRSSILVLRYGVNAK
ncbi:hypothetical protein AgCh_025055 [Apium graveolens]